MSENGHNPDILTCLANLSNDEVFTPPTVANAMLDLLPPELFRRSDVRFCDPFSKSGVFLREIARRLIDGLAAEIPDLQARVEHIMHRQLFGMAITEMTAMLSRRTLYCSRNANSKNSVSRFERPEGNIRFQPVKHEFVHGRCRWCGASETQFGYRQLSANRENHAYEFIHTANPKELFKMEFDVIVGNPPYQLADGGGNGASAKPIYHLFVQQAKKLKPRYLIMITPSRWFTGGKGLDEFRDEMLGDNHILCIHDYIEASDCFSNVQIKGGVSYFLWDRDKTGLCAVYSHKDDKINGPVLRPLKEKGSDIFIRYNEAINILHKVKEKSKELFVNLVSSRMPFGLPNTYKGNPQQTSDDDIQIYVSGNDKEIRGTVAYIPNDKIIKGREMIEWHKVFISKAGSGSDTFPHLILTKPFYGAPNTICNETYLVIGPFENKFICENVISYISTKFFRFLVLLKKNSQNAAKSVYSFVPMQDFSRPWSDAELYAKYGLTAAETAFIESMIRPME